MLTNLLKLNFKKKLEGDLYNAKNLRCKYIINIDDYDSEDFIEILIKEVNKNLIEVGPSDKYRKVIVRKMTIIGRRLNINSKNPGENPKDLEKILFLLKKIPGFIRFIKYNGLKDEVLRNIIPFIKHIKYIKGSTIFKQGDLSNNFYILARGKISMRIKKEKKRKSKVEDNVNVVIGNKEKTIRSSISKKSLFNQGRTFSTSLGMKQDIKKKSEKISIFSDLLNLQNSPQEEEFFEIMQINPGECFGEWAIIFDTPRSATAYVSEESDLFILDKENFNDYLTRFVTKSDYERKHFIKNRINTFNKMTKFDEYYKKIIPMFVEKNFTIFREGDEGRYIYLVYEGEFSIEKDIIFDNSSYDGNSKKKILGLEKGAFIGLEIIFEENKRTYDYSLVSNFFDFNVVFKIDLESMSEFQNSIKNDLKQIYIDQKKMLDNFSLKHKKIKIKNSLSYRNLIPKNESIDMKIIKDRSKQIEREIYKNNISPLKLNETEPKFFNMKMTLNENYLKNSESFNNFRKSRNTTQINLMKNPNNIFDSGNKEENNNQVTQIKSYQLNLNFLYLTHTKDQIENPIEIPNFVEAGLNESNKFNSTNTARSPIKIVKKKIVFSNNKYLNDCANSWKKNKNSKSQIIYSTSNWNLPLISSIDKKDKEINHHN